jgi:DNA-binding beta-propeller fold protein YncE
VPALVLFSLLLLFAGPPAGAQSVITTVPIADARCLALNSQTNRVYVATDTGVTVVDGQTHSILGEYPVAGGAEAVAVNPLTNRLYVAGDDARQLLVLDAATGTQVGVIDELIHECSEIAIDPVRNRVWLEDRSVVLGVPDRAVVYDGATNTRLTSIDLGSSPVIERIRVAVDPVLNRGYATYSGDNTLSVIDGSSFAVLAQVAVGSGVDSVAAHSARGRAYVETSAGVVVVDGTTYAQLALIGQRGKVALNSATDRIYVGRPRKLHIADGGSHAVVLTVDLPSYNPYLAVNEQTGRVYIAHRYHDLLSVVQDVAP